MSTTPIYDAVRTAVDQAFAELQARRDLVSPDNHPTYAEYLRCLAQGERAAADLYNRAADAEVSPTRPIVVAGLRLAARVCQDQARMYDKAADHAGDARKA